jgi:dihydrofolate synthase/folylpolyglutamate synthase
VLNPKKFEIPSKATYKLERILLAAALTDHPELGRKTVLVAGTNGKGSTCAYLTAFFISAGYRVGTFSSPHVIRRTERIRIDGEQITELELRAYEKKYARILEPLSFFERYTLLAFLIFRDRKVDVQVLEVGLGGRLDATNISDPDLSVISRIDYDHQEILGKTLNKIAGEKAGIMREGRPVLVGKQVPKAFVALKKYAKKIHAEFSNADQIKFSKTIENEIKKIRLLRGPHQEDNLRLAFASFQRAMNQWAWNFDESEIVSKFLTPLWPARIQILRKQPLFVVDGSHNMNSVDALVVWLKKQKIKNWQCIFGAMVDKPIDKMFRTLMPYISEVYLPTFYPERQVSSAELEQQLLKLAKTRIRIHNSKNFELTLNALWASEKPVLVVGSLYLAGSVLGILESKGKIHEQA